MLATLKTQTRFEGKILKAGDKIEVADVIAKRWVNRGIASVEVTASTKKPEVEVKPIEAMTAKELYALCVEQGLDVKAKQPKEAYLEALSSAKSE